MLTQTYRSLLFGPNVSHKQSPGWYFVSSPKLDPCSTHSLVVKQSKAKHTFSTFCLFLIITHMFSTYPSMEPAWNRNQHTSNNACYYLKDSLSQLQLFALWRKLIRWVLWSHSSSGIFINDWQSRWHWVDLQKTVILGHTISHSIRCKKSITTY